MEHTDSQPLQLMHGRTVLVTGIANHKSIAYGCARKLRQHGARLAITYLNDKARPYVEPLADQLGAEIFMPLDVTQPAQLDDLFSEITTQWGGLHGLIHSIAYCPPEDLHAPISACSREGFSQALDISCYSFIDMARRAQPLMHHGGSLISFSYQGSAMAVEDYNVMGVAKAALEASTRYLARDLGPDHIRVNCISPGTIATRAASGIKDFDKMLAYNQQKSVDGLLPSIDEVGDAALYFLSDLSRGVSGSILHVDHGVHIVG